MILLKIFIYFFACCKISMKWFYIVFIDRTKCIMGSFLHLHIVIGVILQLALDMHL